MVAPALIQTPEDDQTAFQHHLGPPVIFASIGLALLLWLLAAPLASRTVTTAATLKSLANIGAFSGTVLYSWSIILSTRWRWLDSWFGGLDKAYKWHHISGGFAFFLLTLHPFFLTLNFITLGKPATTLWLVGGNWQINFGVLALYALVLLIPVTIFLHLKHELFVRLHQILGAVFYLGFVHAILANGNMARFWPLRFYMIGIMVAAMYGFIYHTILGGVIPRRFLYRVGHVKDLGQGVTEIILEPKGRLLHFMPGQFVYVNFYGHPINAEAHPYSIASSPLDTQIRFVIKTLGDYTAGIPQLQVGTTAKLEGPHGGFSFRRFKGRKQIWIAGGIGITPFLSMARSLPKSRYSIDFYYCVQTMAAAPFAAELQTLAAANPNFRVHVFCQDSQGFLNADILAKDANIQEREFLICGPPPMMAALAKGLEAKGVKESVIHYEDFSFK